jgi:hypothetical protein
MQASQGTSGALLVLTFIGAAPVAFRVEQLRCGGGTDAQKFADVAGRQTLGC